jgi:hypothetical protein
MPNPHPTPLGYRDATGARHQVLVRRSPEGAWQVLDLTVIETLTGVGEGREAAEAVAREYVAQHHHPTATGRPHATQRSAA